MTRRLRAAGVAAAVLGVAVALAACGGGDDTTSSETGSGGSGGGELETISLVQPVPGESLFFYPYMVGESLGFFEEEGVKVDYLSASSDLPLPAFVENGDADMAAAGADELLTATSKGGEFVVTYEEFTVAADTISVLDDSEIQSVADLEGETVGVAGQDDRVVLLTAMDIENVDPGSVQIIQIGEGSPTIAKALKDGQISAYSSGISDVAITEALGEVTLRNILPEEMEASPSATFAVTPETFENKREALTGFLRAWAKATQAGLLDRTVVEEVGRERTPEAFENEEIVKAILDISIDDRDPGSEPFGTLQVEEWENSQEQLLNAGEQKTEVDIESLLDEALVPAANEFDDAEVEAAIDAYHEKKGK